MGILNKARILEWAAVPPPGESSQPRDQTLVFCVAGRFFSIWTTREAREEWSGVACPFSSRSPWPRNQTRVSLIAGGFFTSWATREAPAEAIYFAPIFLWLYAKCIPYLGFTLTTLCPLQFFLLQISKKAREPAKCQTQRLGYWCSLWLPLKHCKREKSRCPFVPHSRLLSASPHLI